MGKIEGMRQVAVYVDPTLLKLAKHKAVEDEVPLYQVINDALRQYISPTKRKV